MLKDFMKKHQNIKKNTKKDKRQKEKIEKRHLIKC